MRKLLVLAFLLIGSLGFSVNVKAAPTEVNTVAELKNIVENATTEIEVKLGDSFPKDQDITLEMNHSHKIEIDGNKEQLKLNSKITINLNKYHDENSQKTLFKFDNFHFDGEGVNDVGIEFGRFENLDNFNSNDVFIVHSTFENSTDSVIKVKTAAVEQYRTLQLLTEDLIIKNNKSSVGGAIFADGQTHIRVDNSSFTNNTNASNVVGGGAISAIGIGTGISVNYSKFINNKITGVASAGKKLGGGAIYHENAFAGMTQSFVSYFEGNETNSAEPQDGGAILVGRNDQEAYVEKLFDIEGSTFTKNKSSGDGGAVSIDLTYAKDLRYQIVKSVFAENSSVGEGGAVSSHADEPVSNYNEFKFIGNTIYKNASGESKGGGISFLNLDFEIPISSSLFAENIGSKNFENVEITTGNIKSIHNLGIDNGTENKVKSETIFGKYPFKLSNNRSLVQVGAIDDQRILPSIPVIPRFTNDKNEVVKGITDLEEANEHEIFFGDIRHRYSDFITIGAVDVASILYDANEGDFNLPELKEFTGEEYFEGANPSQYASLELPGDFAFVKDGKEDLKVSRDGYEFKGWSTEKNGPIATDMQAGQALVSQGQTKLFAVWKANQYQMKYFGNGHTSGVAPKMTKSPFGENLKVKDANTLKRTGYTFVGWSEKATASKADPKYKPGEDYKVKSKNNLYAVWQRESNEVKYAANKATSGAAPKSAKVLYGNSVKLKNGGTMKRKGYTFTGWSMNKKATKAQYKVGKSLKITKSTTLYAIWKKK